MPDDLAVGFGLKFILRMREAEVYQFCYFAARPVRKNVQLVLLSYHLLGPRPDTFVNFDGRAGHEDFLRVGPFQT